MGAHRPQRNDQTRFSLVPQLEYPKKSCILSLSTDPVLQFRRNQSLGANEEICQKQSYLRGNLLRRALGDKLLEDFANQPFEIYFGSIFTF